MFFCRDAVDQISPMTELRYVDDILVVALGRSRAARIMRCITAVAQQHGRVMGWTKVEVLQGRCDVDNV